MAATQEAQKLAYAKKLERAIPGIISDQQVGHSEKAIAAINKALDYCARFDQYQPGIPEIAARLDLIKKELDKLKKGGKKALLESL